MNNPGYLGLAVALTSVVGQWNFEKAELEQRKKGWG